MNYNDQDDLPNLVTEGISKGVFSFKEHGLHLADPRVDAKNFITSTSKEIVEKCLGWLYANPNYVGGRDYRDSFNYFRFLNGIATYGNLNDDKIAQPLKEYLEDEPKKTDRWGIWEIAKSLTMRKDLTEDLARTLDGARATDYSLLANTPAHRRLVRLGELTSHNMAPLAPLVISPELNSQELASLYATIMAPAYAFGDIMQHECAFALHPSANLEFAMDILAFKPYDATYLEEALPKSNTPHFKEILDFLYKQPNSDLSEWGRIQICAKHAQSTSEHLLSVITKDCLDSEGAVAAERIFCHPNFPLREFSITPAYQQWRANYRQNLIGIADVEDIVALEAAHNVPQVGGTRDLCQGDCAPAALFYPNLAGFRITQIAEAIPEIAGIASNHPNYEKMESGRAGGNAIGNASVDDGILFL